MTCPRCDQEHTKCTAHTRAGNPCRQNPVTGLTVCRMHGGSAPQVRAARDRRAEEAAVAERIAEMLAHYELPLDQVDNHTELLEVVQLTGAMRRVLTQLVGELAPQGTPAYVEYQLDAEGYEKGDPTYRPAEPAGIYGPDHKGDGKPHVLVEMLRQWTAENAKAAKLAIDAGIDERRVRIVEEQAEQLSSVVRAVATALIGRVGELVDDAHVARTLNGELPTIIRGAITNARIIDTTGDETP